MEFAQLPTFFGFSGSPIRVLPRLHRLLIPPSRGEIAGLVFPATWMSDSFIRLSRSDLQSIQQAALNLSEASARLASELTDILCGGYWICRVLTPPGDWEVENNKLKAFLQFRGADQGPPPTPDFLLHLLDESVGVFNRSDQEDWARPSFWAGYWARAALTTNTPWTSDYLPEHPVYWIVLRGGDWEEPSVFESLAEVNRFVSRTPTDQHIIQPLLDYIEIFIFCSGASIGPPGRWLWTRRS